MRLQIGPFVVVTPFSCFSSKDSHQFRLKRNVFSSFLQKLLLFHKEYYTFWKLSRVCINMIADNLIKSPLFAKQLYTFSKMIQVSIKMNIIKLDKLDNCINIDKLHKTW